MLHFSSLLSPSCIHRHCRSMTLRQAFRRRSRPCSIILTPWSRNRVQRRVRDRDVTVCIRAWVLCQIRIDSMLIKKIHHHSRERHHCPCPQDGRMGKRAHDRGVGGMGTWNSDDVCNGLNWADFGYPKFIFFYKKKTNHAATSHHCRRCRALSTISPPQHSRGSLGFCRGG
jgi:hypothetical protein